jgi:hypothetical protein
MWLCGVHLVRAQRSNSWGDRSLHGTLQVYRFRCDGTVFVGDCFEGNGPGFDAFATKLVKTKPGVLDDGPEPGKVLWGVYVVTPLPWLRGASVESLATMLERFTLQRFHISPLVSGAPSRLVCRCEVSHATGRHA